MLTLNRLLKPKVMLSVLDTLSQQRMLDHDGQILQDHASRQIRQPLLEQGALAADATAHIDEHRPLAIGTAASCQQPLEVDDVQPGP